MTLGDPENLWSVQLGCPSMDGFRSGPLRAMFDGQAFHNRGCEFPIVKNWHSAVGFLYRLHGEAAGLFQIWAPFSSPFVLSAGVVALGHPIGRARHRLLGGEGCLRRGPESEKGAFVKLPAGQRYFSEAVLGPFPASLADETIENELSAPRSSFWESFSSWRLR